MRLSFIRMLKRLDLVEQELKDCHYYLGYKSTVDKALESLSLTRKYVKELVYESKASDSNRNE